MLSMTWSRDYLSGMADISSRFTHLTWLTANSLLWLGSNRRVSDCSPDGEQEWICLRMLVLNISLICLMLPAVGGCGDGLLNRSSASQKCFPIWINEEDAVIHERRVTSSWWKSTQSCHAEIVGFRQNMWERLLLFPDHTVSNRSCTRCSVHMYSMWLCNGINDQEWQL